MQALPGVGAGAPMGFGATVAASGRRRSRARVEIGADAPVVVAEVLPQARQDADQVHMHGMARADRVAGEDGGEDALVLGVGDFHTLVLTK